MLMAKLPIHTAASMTNALVDTIQLPNQPTGVELYLYRGDKEHPDAPGNKWHKLKHHLQRALWEGYTYIATFGGPYSNHIHAFASSCSKAGLMPLVVVRGETAPQLTPTLKDAVAAGAILFPSLRKDYRLGLNASVKAAIDQEYGRVYWVPEGGGGDLGVQGCRDWGYEIGQRTQALGCDAWAVAAGTGTTAIGLAQAQQVENLCIFSALQGASVQHQQIVEQVGQGKTCLSFWDDDWNGGFGKLSDSLRQFIEVFHELNPSVRLDPIYTGKALYKINALMGSGRWQYTRTLMIHTGGLQGWRGFNG